MTRRENTPSPDAGTNEQRQLATQQTTASSAGLLIVFVVVLGLVILYGAFSN
jgi:hypothetical protein